jgi:hypothetical protein
VVRNGTVAVVEVHVVVVACGRERGERRPRDIYRSKNPLVTVALAQIRGIKRIISLPSYIFPFYSISFLLESLLLSIWSIFTSIQHRSYETNRARILGIVLGGENREAPLCPQIDYYGPSRSSGIDSNHHRSLDPKATNQPLEFGLICLFF